MSYPENQFFFVVFFKVEDLLFDLFVFEDYAIGFRLSLLFGYRLTVSAVVEVKFFALAAAVSIMILGSFFMIDGVAVATLTIIYLS